MRLELKNKQEEGGLETVRFISSPLAMKDECKQTQDFDLSLHTCTTESEPRLHDDVYHDCDNHFRQALCVYAPPTSSGPS